MGADHMRLRDSPFARVMMLAACVAVAAAATFGVVRALSSPASTSTSSPLLGIGPAPTVAHPLPPSAQQVSATAASSALGASLTLPRSASVSPSEAGAFWLASAHASDGESRVSVAVTFPSHAFAVRYTRPAYPDPLANYQSFVNAYPNGSQLIYLHGVPALLQTSTRPDGSTWDAVEFVKGGTIIVVMGNAQEAALQSAAQSIVDQK